MIEIKGVSKRYAKTVLAVSKLDLTVPKGSIFGFLGPNGAGKTTTIKMVTGVLQQDEGRILVNNFDTLTDSVHAKKQIGYVPDNPNRFLRLSGMEYLNFLADMYDVPTEKRKDHVLHLSKRFEMHNALNDKIQSYSHGMRQKIVIIGALLHNPPVWILDEPLTGLDPRSAFVLKEMMREHADKGNCVFFSTHVLDVAEKICDQVAIVRKGEILFAGGLDAMKEHFAKHSSLEQLFLELTENQ